MKNRSWKNRAWKIIKMPVEIGIDFLQGVVILVMVLLGIMFLGLTQPPKARKSKRA